MQPPRARRLTIAAAATVTAVLAALLGVAAPAEAADRTIAVTSTADAASPACTDPSITTTGSPVTLRAALCVASNLGGSTLVTIPDGTFRLAERTIAFGTRPGTSIEIAGASNTVIDGGGVSGIFAIDEGMAGGIDVSIRDLRLTGGVDNVFGGGAIIAGSGYATVPDTLTVTNTVFSGNSANTGGAGSTANHGGAIQFAGGSLSIASSTFSGNNSGVADGGAVSYQATGASADESLSITGTSFTANAATASGSNGGAALAISDPTGGATLSISGSAFSNNHVNGTGTFPGAAVWLNGGSLAVTGSAFAGNTASTGEGSALAVSAGTLTGTGNRFVGNSAPAVRATSGSASVTRSWWGCAGGPGSTGCDSVGTGTVSAPYLTYGLSASPTSIVQPAQTAAVTATAKDSDGGAVQPGDLAALSGVTVSWAVSGIANATISPSSGTLGSGSTSAVVTSSRSGLATVTATAGGPVSLALPVYAPPSFSSGALATGVVGVPGTFTVTAAGYPVPALTATGSLPAGVTFSDNHDGTATVSGTPSGAAADYTLDVTATNAGGTATQTLTYSLYAAAAFSSANAATFTAGTPGSFTVTTTGRPTPDPITLAGALPSGVTFTDHHDGTATIAGTPAAGTGGAYALVFGADNGKGSAAQQSFTLTVDEAPAFTSGWEAAVTVGDAVTIPITTAHAYPVPALSAGAPLPAGLAFTDNGDGTATIAGTPAGPGGTVTVPLTAANGVSTPATGSLVITVRERPAVTLPLADQRVLVGATASFTAAASGFPAPAVSWSVSADGGLTWTTIAGETSATLAFTAARADDGHVYRATFTNAVGIVSTQARLAVGTTPAFSSAAGAAFPADGKAHTFAVTTSGLPAATLTAGGTMPPWLTFTPGPDGTATLAGTPPVGSGGTYPLTFTAANGYQPDATQAFVLTVTEPAAITSPDAATFAVGASGAFTVTTNAGYPTATALSVTGALPAGLAFVDRGDGTGTLSGTPAPAWGGVYAVQVIADNGTTASQTLTLTVTEAAAFTTPAALTVERGVMVDFAIATAHAYPAVTSVALTGTLPTGLTFATAGGAATISGTTLDTAGTVTVELTARAPGAADVTQTLTLTVVDVAAELLPLTPPAGDGPVVGVPSAPQAGQSITLVAPGFAVDSPVTFGIYSSPVVLAVVTADAQGVARATVTIPAGYTGAHSLVAIGTAPDGSTRALRTDIVLPDGSTGGGSGGSTGGGSGSTGGGAATGGGSGTDAAGAGPLADTGLDVSGLLLLAIALLGMGAAAVARRRVRA